jgi:hypothetical protein
MKQQQNYGKKLKISTAIKRFTLKSIISSKKIIKITQKSRDVPTLIGHVRAKYEELKFYRPNTTDLKVLQERDEMDRIYTFLAALEPNYELIRAWITTQIRQEALRRVAMGTPDSNPKSEAHPSQLSASTQTRAEN